MGAGATLFDSGFWQLLFNNSTAGLTAIGSAAGLQPSSVAGGLYISLHTASPGKTGAQSTSEITYTGYTRQSLPRATTGWQVSAPAGTPASAWNLSQVQFPTLSAAEAGTYTATHVGLGTDASGSGNLLMFLALSASVVLAANYIPLFPSASLLFTAD